MCKSVAKCLRMGGRRLIISWFSGDKSDLIFDKKSCAWKFRGAQDRHHPRDRASGKVSAFHVTRLRRSFLVAISSHDLR